MTTIPAQSIAESYAEQAEINFKRDGNLAPLMAWYGPTTVQALISEQGSMAMQETAAMLTLTYSACIEPPPTHVVIVNEAWQKSQPWPEGEPPPDWKEIDKDYPRGRLQQLADEGDTSVKTVLIIYVISATDPEDCCGIIIEPENGYNRMVSTGTVNVAGGLPDRIREANSFVPRVRAKKPPDYTLARAIEFLAPLVGAVLAPADTVDGISEDVVTIEPFDEKEHT